MVDYGETLKCPKCGRIKFKNLKCGKSKCYGVKCGYEKPAKEVKNDVFNVGETPKK